MHLPSWPVRSQLLELSRNFGSFAAIGAGLAAAKGDYVAVIAADLQEPPELVVEFEKILSSGSADVVFGRRERRSDPWLSQLLSSSFWAFYRRFVVPEMPRGGIDVFGCTRQVRDALVQMRELNTSLVALLLWLGFRREVVSYERQARLEGRSAWSLGRKIRYALDSVFNFTDLPIRVLLVVGATATRDLGRRNQLPDSTPFKWDWVGQKCFDDACPIGPWMVPASDIKDPQKLGIKLWVNDVIKQDSNTSDMIFNLAEQLSHLSSRITLYPGDIILTGTPAGVGAARREFLKAGDTTRVWVENVGTLTNKMA